MMSIPSRSKKTAEAKSVESGRYAYEDLDRVVHERARLGILTSLVSQPAGLSFNDLKRLCNLTDGNLNRHLAVLSETEFVSVEKLQGEGRGQTMVELTATGRTRFLEYISALESVVADAVAAEKRSAAVGRAARKWSAT
jgi:predicted ArsR family transcriptional regulator